MDSTPDQKWFHLGSILPALSGLYRALLIGIFAIAGTVVSASPYTIVSSHAAYDSHWDEWICHYSPGAGWTFELFAGNTADMLGDLGVIANDGTSGQIVNLEITFQVRYNSYFMVPFDYDGSDFSNFTGLSGGIQNVMQADSSGFAGPKLTQTISRPVIGRGSDTFTMNTPFLVGAADDIPFTAGILFGNHTVPIDLEVFDKAKPASFGLYTEMTVFLISARVTDATEVGTSLLTLGGVLTGLFLLRPRTEAA